MNPTKLFEMQRKLDEHIMNEHPELKGQNNLDWKILALQVELGECANEWRGFKKWSNRQTPKMYPRETCDYCEEESDYVRPTPFMADIGSSMCKACWDSTKEEYAASNGEFIPAFEDYQHFPKKEPIKLLEEFVDCLHFILSIGLELNFTPESVMPVRSDNGILFQFSNVFDVISELRNAPIIDNEYWIYLKLFKNFVGLGEMFGFTWEQIEQAYYEKNAVNHQRQTEGY